MQITREDSGMEFHTEIKWKGGTQEALEKLRVHLQAFNVDRSLL
jgi:hypothetical protein